MKQVTFESRGDSVDLVLREGILGNELQRVQMTETIARALLDAVAAFRRTAAVNRTVEPRPRFDELQEDCDAIYG